MKAGRELNKRVAEEVMGECFHEWEREGINFVKCRKCKVVCSTPVISYKNNPYSTNIAHAFEVLAVVRTWDAKRRILFYANMIDEFGWDQNQWWMYDAEVVANRICNAAYKVKKNNESN